MNISLAEWLGYIHEGVEVYDATIREWARVECVCVDGSTVGARYLDGKARAFTLAGDTLIRWSK